MKNQKIKIKIQRYKLANGVRVILIPDNRATMTCAEVAVEIGSGHETKRTNGTAHFLEHMLCAGTKKRKSNKKINIQLRQMGGKGMHALTSCWTTSCFVYVPSPHSLSAVDVLLDCFMNATIKKSAVEREKEPILQEIAEYEDSSVEKAALVVGKLVSGDTPLGRNICGTRNIVRNMTAKKLHHFRDSFYVPNATVVTIAGRFKKKAIKRLLEKTIGKLPQCLGKIPIIQKPSKNGLGQQCLLVARRTKQTRLAMGINTIGLVDNRFNVLELIVFILDNRIEDKIRGKMDLVYSASVRVNSVLSTGMITIEAGIAPDNLKKAVKAILVELSKLANKKIGHQELKMVKAQYKGAIYADLETSGGKVGVVNEKELHLKERKSLDSILEECDNVTAKDIIKLSQEIFRSGEKLKLAVVGSHKNISKAEQLMAKFSI